VWQDHRRRNRHTELGGEGIVEKFVVGTPPDGLLTTTVRSMRRFQISAVERDVMRDAVNDDGVAARIGHFDAPD